MTTPHPDRGLFDAYLLDDLDPAARREVADHLAGCASCRAELSALSAPLDAYRDAAPGAAPAGLLHALLAAQQAATAARSRRRRVAALRALAATAAGAILFVTGYWCGRRPSASPATPPERAIAAPAATAPRAEPKIVFVSVDPDQLGGLALRDTTVN